MAQAQNNPHMHMGGSDGNSAVYQMQKYFGPLRNSDVEAWASDQFAHETHNLPKAYEGRNKFMMATIDFLITKDDDWYTRFALPWEYTEELNVVWNIWRFNRTMMDYEPHQGVPRYVTQESESHKDSLSRRGLAFIIEHGFWKTELGRSHYLMNLRQIVEAVHETCFFGVMMALLGADNYYEQWHRKHGTLHKSTLQTITQDEKFLWGVCQKNVKGLFVLDAEIKDRMRRKGIEPTGWVFPPKMAIYASMCPEYMTEYKRRGSPASTALEVGAKAFDTFRGLPVYETRTFDVDFQGEGIDPMTENAQCGEYYEFRAEDQLRGIKIFDMDKNCFDKIDFSTVKSNLLFDDGEDPYSKRLYLPEEFRAEWLGACNNDIDKASDHLTRLLEGLGPMLTTIFGVDGTDLADRRRAGAPALGLDDTQSPVVRILNSPGGGPHPLKNAMIDLFERQEVRTHGIYHAQARFIADVLLEDPADPGAIPWNDPAQQWNMAAWENEHKVSLRPYKFLLMRPWCTYQMSHAILGRFGEELGQTFHGHHDFQLTDDIIHKVHIGHYTFYSKSIVRSPKHMYLAKNVYCQGYVHGENNTFVKNANDLPGNRDRVASIVALAVPICESLPNPLCASKNGFHESMPTVDLNDNDSGKFNLIRGLRGGIVEKPDLPAILQNYFQEDDHSDDTVQHNHVCWKGAVHRYNEGTGLYDIEEVSTGHWGTNVYDGCGDVRRGMYASFKE